MSQFSRRLAVLILGASLGVDLMARQQPSRPEAVSLSPVVLAKLSQEWRDAAKHVKAIDREQQRFLKMSDVVLRQNLARILIRSRAADGFLRSQVTKDPSPAVRVTIVQAMTSDSRWRAADETSTLLEGVVARDPDPVVSLAAV